MNKKVILYSTGCPKCSQLKKLLNDFGVEYSEITDTIEMLSLGFDEVPMLKVGDRIMDYTDAVNAIKNGEVK